jgi:hypothetical protein
VAVTRYVVALTILLLGAAARAGEPSPVERLQWIAGDWLMSRGGTCVEEHWTQPAGGMLTGMSRTVAGDRTRSFEFMRIESRPDGVYFVAQPGGRPPVDFRMASSTDSEIVFINPGHADHLKRIVYRRSAPAEITARIEGEDGGKAFAIDYVYRAAAGAGCRTTD